MICKCGWKHTNKICPMCGKSAPKTDRKVRQWNSSLSARPKNRPRPKSGDDLKQAMMEKAKEHMRLNPHPICEHCRIRLPYLRYENISHNLKRSLAPSKRLELENMTVLCGPQNYYGQIDRSCHTLWERNRFDEYGKMKDQRRGMRGT